MGFHRVERLTNPKFAFEIIHRTTIFRGLKGGWGNFTADLADCSALAPLNIAQYVLEGATKYLFYCYCMVDRNLTANAVPALSVPAVAVSVVPLRLAPNGSVSSPPVALSSSTVVAAAQLGPDVMLPAM